MFSVLQHIKKSCFQSVGQVERYHREGWLVPKVSQKVLERSGSKLKTYLSPICLKFLFVFKGFSKVF